MRRRPLEPDTLGDRNVSPAVERPWVADRSGVPLPIVLDPRHLEYLAARAVPEPTARAARLRSVDGAEGAGLLGCEKPLRCPGLAIPYFDAADGILSWRVRLDEPGEGPRYLAPRGPVRPYLPPAGVVSADVWTDPTRAVYVVEAPVKALALAVAGWPAIGLGGVSAGGHDVEAKRKDGVLRPHSDLAARVTLQTRPFTLVFDAGRSTNAMVANAEAMLAAALAAGGAVVRVAALPLAEGGKDQGPDDYLAAHGPHALRTVIESAQQADPLARVHALRELADRDARGKAAIQLLADLPWVAAVRLAGAAVLDRVADELGRAAAIRRTTLRERVEGFAAALQAKAECDCRGPASAASGPHPEWHYHDHGGALCAWSSKKLGDQHVPLATFSARIVEEIERDDGEERTRRYVISGALADGTTLPRAEVDAAEYASMAWTASAWGARAAIVAGPRARDQAREAIQQLSTPRRRVRYVHTGWREIDDRRVFLYHGGAVGAADASVELQPPLDRYRLPDAAEDVPGAVRVSLALLDCGPPEIMIPLLAVAYLAPLAELAHPDLSLYLLGASGALKSTLAALALSHFGAWDRLHLPCDWSATDNSLEIRLHAAKDVLCVIDDVAPQPDARSRDELQRRVARILRSIGNRSGRGRLRADLSQRPDRPPRGLVIVTGEDLPGGASVVARTVVVPVKRELLKLEEIATAQREAARLPHAMRGYIEWLAPQWDSLRVEAERMWTTARDQLRAAGAAHLRHPEALAHLFVGLDVGLTFAVEVKVIDDARAEVIRGVAWEVLAGQAVEQAERQRDADPAEQWIRALRTLIAQGRVELVAKGKPLDAGARGRDANPNVRPIGWIDNSYVYLWPEAAQEQVAQLLRQSGNHLVLGARALYDALARRGYLEPDKDGHTTVKVRCAPGNPVRVLRVPRSVVPAPRVPSAPRSLLSDARSGDSESTDGEAN